MSKSIDDILNPPETEETETTTETGAETGTDTEGVETESIEQETETETTEETVATETTGTSPEVKAQLDALAKERYRLQQKEAEINKRLAEVDTTAATTAETRETTETTAKNNPREEMKTLRKQYREALSESLLDPEDPDAAKKVEDLEDQMEDLRLRIVREDSQAKEAKTQSTNDFNGVLKQAHEDFPFLADDPANHAGLHEDIDAYYYGRIQRGDSPAAALKKAVDKFAPAYAETLGGHTAESAEETARKAAEKAEADTLIRQKLKNSGFSEVRSASRTQATKPFTGPTPMRDILGGKG